MRYGLPELFLGAMTFGAQGGVDAPRRARPRPRGGQARWYCTGVVTWPPSSAAA